MLWGTSYRAGDSTGVRNERKVSLPMGRIRRRKFDQHLGALGGLQIELGGGKVFLPLPQV